MIDNIKRLINDNRWDDARVVLNEYKSSISENEYDDILAILEASIFMASNDSIRAMECLKKGLKYNLKNYECYFMMGNLFEESKEFERACLCYENALFYCNQSEDRDFIYKSLQNLKSYSQKLPNKVAIVILTYNNLKYTKLCIESIKLNNDKRTYELIIVDNHSTDGTVEWLKSQTDIKLVLNEDNKGFPAGCNQGIKIAEESSDILLLNNDTVVLENSIFNLRMALYSKEEVGAVGAVSNKVSNNQDILEQYSTIEEYYKYAKTNNITNTSRYERRMMLVGFALLMKRAPLNNVGLLDERFSPGNYEDTDISLRFLMNKYQLLLCHDCFIYHFGSVSFSQDLSYYYFLLSTNYEKFKNKWEMDFQYYTFIRYNIIQMITEDKDAPIRVLEVGCACGATILKIMSDYPNSSCYGIELNSFAANVASCSFPTIQGDIEEMELNYEPAYFDYIIFADVLEHLRDPYLTLNKIRKFLKPGGHVLASIPNILNHSVIIPLLKGNFTYQEAGILDKTHLRFFTINEIEKMFYNAGYKIDGLYNTTNKIEASDEQLINQLCALEGSCEKWQFLAYQYLVSAMVQ